MARSRWVSWAAIQPVCVKAPFVRQHASSAVENTLRATLDWLDVIVATWVLPELRPTRASIAVTTLAKVVRLSYRSKFSEHCRRPQDSRERSASTHLRAWSRHQGTRRPALFAYRRGVVLVFAAQICRQINKLDVWFHAHFAEHNFGVIEKRPRNSRTNIVKSGGRSRDLLVPTVPRERNRRPRRSRAADRRPDIWDFRTGTGEHAHARGSGHAS